MTIISRLWYLIYSKSFSSIYYRFFTFSSQSSPTPHQLILENFAKATKVLLPLRLPIKLIRLMSSLILLIGPSSQRPILNGTFQNKIKLTFPPHQQLNVNVEDLAKIRLPLQKSHNLKAVSFVPSFNSFKSC